jgi:hypothetical protein
VNINNWRLKAKSARHMTKGYFFIQYPFSPERFQREPMGCEH